MPPECVSSWVQSYYKKRQANKQSTGLPLSPRDYELCALSCVLTSLHENALSSLEGYQWKNQASGLAVVSRLQERFAVSRLWHVIVGNFFGKNAPHLPDVNSEHSLAQSTFPSHPYSQSRASNSYLPSVANYDKLVPKRNSFRYSASKNIPQCDFMNNLIPSNRQTNFPTTQFSPRWLF